MKGKKRQRMMMSGEEERDRLSELPDCVLLSIMNLMNTAHAVRTCVLSKRWKNLWKRLSRFSLRCDSGINNYNKFLSEIVVCRDESVSLLSLELTVFRSTARGKLIKNLIEHAASHNVEQLTISTDFRFKISNSFVPNIFACHRTLKFLDLSGGSGSSLDIPNSLPLPSLETLHLTNVSFTASTHIADPFLTCYALKTLVLKLFIHHDAKLLKISNSNLSSLKLDNIFNSDSKIKIALSTPNLTSITALDNLFSSRYELSSACELPYLEHVNIDRLTI